MRRRLIRRRAARRQRAQGLPAFRLQPSVGMSAAEVTDSAWGEPLDKVNEEVVEGMIHTWHYDGNRSVHFDHQGRVAEVRR